MCREYEQFDIIEVAEKCGIQFHPRQRNNVEFIALCPFCGDRKYHLGLNRKKGMFHCFRCKESGNSVSLYAKLNGVSNKEAYQALKANMEIFEPKNVFSFCEQEMPIRSLEERHNVYYDFLKLLRLQSCHFENLEQRGLSLRYIHQFMYKSIPVDNVFRREVLEELASNHDLIGIPGFYRDERGEIQMYCKQCGGIFIPVCNKDGYIQGLQMRLDVPTCSSGKKFRWFSSKNFNDGTGAKAWIHVVGDTTADTACLTEGAMKADITSVLSNGQLFIAVPGVNAVNQLIEVIHDLGVRKIYEAFDMDKRSKPEVKDALIKLRIMLRCNGIECVSCSWNSAYKGIDDYMLSRTRASETIAA